MWTPGPFVAYRALYPATPPLPVVADDRSTAFAAAWALPAAELDGRLVELGRGLRIGFVRGFLGNWMPGNLVAPARALRALGLRAAVLATASGASVQDNLARLAAQLGGEEALLLCGHSKGGLECLALADADEGVRRRLRGVVLSQSPRGASGVLESLLLRRHQDSLGGTHRRLAEAVQRAGLVAIGARPGGTELTAEPLAALVDRLDRVRRDYPVWQTASWSQTPTTWLDSFHQRLGELRPGCAHDGQFFLEDLVWPGLPHVLLARVDHAQPVMGGHGFDHVRYWKVVLLLFLGG